MPWKLVLAAVVLLATILLADVANIPHNARAPLYALIAGTIQVLALFPLQSPGDRKAGADKALQLLFAVPAIFAAFYWAVYEAQRLPDGEWLSWLATAIAICAMYMLGFSSLYLIKETQLGRREPLNENDQGEDDEDENGKV